MPNALFMKNIRAYCAEFIGTFFLVLTVCTAGVLGYAGPYAPIAIGATLMVMVYATGYVSGGHLNPAVTLAAWVRGKLPGCQVLPYILAQLLAGFVAAWVAKMFIGPGITVAPSTFSFYPALAAEFLYTFALCYVVLNVATAEGNDGNNFYGLAIGFTVMVGAFTVGKISGGAFNPAVAAGLTTIGGVSPLNSWIYYIGDVGRGLIAGMVFYLLKSENERESPTKHAERLS